MCLNIGTLKTVNFAFGTNGKLMVLSVPILKHFRVFRSLEADLVLTLPVGPLPQGSV